MSAFLDSDMRRGARVRLEHHTAQCAECRRLLAELRQMVGLLRGTPSPQPASGASAIASAVLLRLDEPAEL
jgi:anti-sigma factor RsiW